MTSNVINWKKPILILLLTMLFWFSIQLINPVYAESKTHTSDIILVKFKENAPAAERANILRMMGGQTTLWIEALSTAQVQLPANWATTRNSSNPFRVASQANNVLSVEFDSFVSGVPFELAQANTLPSMANSTIPLVPIAVNDTDLNDLQKQVYAPNRINLALAWNYSMGSNDIKIAILDSGILATHPEFEGRLLPGYDFINNDADPHDDFGHGTHVAGIAAAGANNGIGMVGVCPQCSIIPVKVLNESNQGTWAGVAAGIVYAVDAGARVINLSLGGSSSTKVLEDAVQYAQDRNVLVVAAAGNGRSDIPFYPAALESVVGVAATRSDDTRWSLSNYGFFVELSAPGYAIYSTYNDLNNTYAGYTYMSGTSMAAPHVAGLAGLLLSHKPQLTIEELRLLLRSTSVDLGDAGRDDYFGYGRIDALAALQAGTPPMQPNASISGTVWQDDNVNGVWEQSERSVNEALLIQIYDSNGNVVAETTTDSDGQWRIENLYPGSYQVIAASLGNTVLTTASKYTVQLASGQEVRDLNFGTIQSDPDALSYRVFVPTVQSTQ